jgi:hypothetical protein
LVIPDMARAMLGDIRTRCKKTGRTCSRNENNICARRASKRMMRAFLIVLFVLALPAAAAAEPRTVKPDRAAINRLLDEFIPAAVAQKDLQRGWELSAGVARTVSHSEWMQGNTSVQKYPAKGTTFRGWTVNYSYAGDIGFDILLQPTTRSLGAWSFRGEARKIHGAWRITTWYPVATFAPPGRTQTVLGPNDLGAADSAAAGSGTSHGRLGSWVLALPLAFVGGIALLGMSVAARRALKRRARIREIQERLRGSM